MPLSVKDFSDELRGENPAYAHLDDADIIQIVTKKDPDLLKDIDRQDLIKVSNESVSKQISKERQKQFGALSGYSRFMAGAGAGMLDTYNGIKQLFGGGVEGYKGDKAAYMDAAKGSKTAAAGEIVGALAATAPTMLIPGAGEATAAKTVSGLAKAAKVAVTLGKAGAVGAGYGATEFVDDGETRAKNAALGALFGAGSAGAASLIKKVGTKAYNALKGQYADAGIQDLMDLSKKYDIPLTKAMVTGKGKNTERALEGIPIVGTGGFMKEGAAKVQAAIKKEADAVNPAWDEVIQESLANKAKAGKAQAKANYDRVDALSSGISIEPKNTIAKVAKHEADVAGSIGADETNIFSKFKKNLIKGPRTFTDLRRDRSYLGNKAAEATRAGDLNLARQLNDVKSGVEDDIEKLVDKKIEVGTFSKAAGSENVDEFYHGSPNKIEKFNMGREGAVYFEKNKQVAQSYAGRSGNVTAHNVKLENPLTLNNGNYAGKQFESADEAVRFAKSNGNDGVIWESDGVKSQIAAFSDTQIKNPSSQKIMGTQKEGLKEAFHTAQEQYKKNVVPYNDKSIVNAIKSETPDEIFDKFIKKGKGDRAGNFYDLLDDKGKSALKDGLIDNAIKGATNPATGEASPAKLAGYLQRMADPIESTLKGADREQVRGLAKVMRHAERYGQMNDSPSNGMALIPYLKAGALAAAGYGGAKNPMATVGAVAGGAALTKLATLMKTKGYKVALASDKIGSPAFEKALNEIIAQLPRVSAVTWKELKD